MSTNISGSSNAFELELVGSCDQDKPKEVDSCSDSVGIQDTEQECRKTEENVM